jgi:hypothetical protein
MGACLQRIGASRDSSLAQLHEKIVERRPREFVRTCWWQQTAPEPHFRKGPMASSALPDHRDGHQGDRV